MNDIEQIFVGQDSLQINLDTKIDLSSAASVEMKYKKPDGTTGSWDASVYETTYVQKDFLKSKNELDVDGVWAFWTYATMSDGRVIPGKAVQYNVRLEGSI